jgi:hypothetical protein
VKDVTFSLGGGGGSQAVPARLPGINFSLRKSEVLGSELAPCILNKCFYSCIFLHLSWKSIGMAGVSRWNPSK